MSSSFVYAIHVFIFGTAVLVGAGFVGVVFAVRKWCTRG